MVENKEESLARARERGQTLNLTNVWYFQANMEYYKVGGGMDGWKAWHCMT